MSLRKASKVIATVGFLICFSSIGILYSNLSSTTRESQDMLNIKNRAIEQLKKELEDRDTKTFTLENRILALERESTQCLDEKVRVEKSSQTLKQSLDELKAKADYTNANMHKLELREDEEKANHEADLKDNLAMLEGLKQELSKEKANHEADLKDNLASLEELKQELSNEKSSTTSLVADLGALTRQLHRAQSETEQQSIELTKCLQGAGQAEIKVADSEKEDVGQHQVQAPVQQEAPKPQAVVDSADHNAPAPVPAQQPVIGGGGALGDQIAALPNAIPAPREARGAGDEANNQQQVGAAPPPLQPAAQHDQFQQVGAAPPPLQPAAQHDQIQPAQPAQEAYQLQPMQPMQPAGGVEAAVIDQPALPQEVQAAPQHP